MYWPVAMSVNSVAVGHAGLVDVHQQLGPVSAFIDVETAVQARIIDEPLPADDGARLLRKVRITMHRLFVLFAGVQTQSVFVDGGGVVDGAGADDDQQALIFTGQNGFHLAAASSRFWAMVG